MFIMFKLLEHYLVVNSFVDLLILRTMLATVGNVPEALKPKGGAKARKIPSEKVCRLLFLLERF